MKPNYFLRCLLTIFSFSLNAQVFDVETIQYNGDPNKFINLVIMGDGYTAAEQGSFMATANSITTEMMTQSPWSNYKNYFNVYAIKVISAESGVKHANTASDCSFSEISNPNNYFGTKFDGFGIHRLTVVTNTSAISNVLATNFPNYDQVFIVGNSPNYGGSGGVFAVFSANSSSTEIAAHEIGHSFAGLADEYYAGDQYFFEKPNMTQQSNPTLVKWKNWLTPETGIGINAYCCGGNSDFWFKPTTGTCKMQQLNVPYCRVCKQGIIEKIHSYVNPIVSFTPNNSTPITSSQGLLDFQLTELMKPIPNTLRIAWQVDATVFETNTENYQINQNILNIGNHTVSATVIDETTFLRVDNHASLHFSTVTWTINRTALGTNIQSELNKIAYTVYPNPSQDVIHLAFDLEKSSMVSIDLIAADGKIICNIPSQKMASGKQENSIPVAMINAATYFVVVTIDGVKHTTTMIKN